MIQKHHIVFILAALCASSLFLSYQRLTLLALAGYEELGSQDLWEAAWLAGVFGGTKDPIQLLDALA
jgi:hypothetical protein